jgi:hypothetical protein
VIFEQSRGSSRLKIEFAQTAFGLLLERSALAWAVIIVLSTLLHPKTLALFVAIPGFALLAGCGREDISFYRAPKEKPVSAESHHSHSPERPHVHYELPPGWKEENPGGMRAASFSIPSEKAELIDVSVIPMPGQAGSELENVNLWRSQLRLEPVSSGNLRAQAEPVQVAGAEGWLYELASEENLIEEKYKVRVLGAIVPRGSTTWFFKMTGEDSAVREQKPVFKQFLTSVTLHEPGEHEGEPEPETASTPPASAALQASGSPSWNVPDAWRETAPPAMVRNQFTIDEAGTGEANMTVTVLPGEGGGLLANINRWRVQQLGIPAVTAQDLAAMTRSVDVMGGKATLVEMAGTDTKTGRSARMIVAIVPRDGQTWFYKLMGDESVVIREKEKFVQFVQTVRY